MSANEEQLQLLNDVGIDHVSYTLVVLSVAFIIYLIANLLISLYETSGRVGQARLEIESERISSTNSQRPFRLPTGQGKGQLINGGKSSIRGNEDRSLQLNGHSTQELEMHQLLGDDDDETADHV